MREQDIIKILWHYDVQMKTDGTQYINNPMPDQMYFYECLEQMQDITEEMRQELKEFIESEYKRIMRRRKLFEEEYNLILEDIKSAI